LQSEWSSKFQPQWASYSAADRAGRSVILLKRAFDGFEKALLRLWDDIKSLFDLLANPRKNYEKLKKYLSDIEIDKLYAASKESIASGLLILSDEPLMFIYISAIVAWVGMLPPQVVVDVSNCDRLGIPDQRGSGHLPDRWRWVGRESGHQSPLHHQIGRSGQVP
jgi:hypothetical protein